MRKYLTGKIFSPTPSKMTACRVGPRPRDDDGYFEQMTKTVFRSGLNWKVIEKKWPDFRKAFADFSIQKVAQFKERDVDRLMKDEGIVRNYRKVVATIENARKLLAIQKEHGSFRRYLKEIGRDGEDQLCRTLSKRFSHLGKSTAVMFLRAVGEEMQEMTRRWMEMHLM